MHTYQPEDLNLILEKFYAELRKTNGTDYEPACLRVMICPLDKYKSCLFFSFFSE